MQMEGEHFCLDGFPEWKASILRDGFPLFLRFPSWALALRKFY
jgi:hypothetical protein